MAADGKIHFRCPHCDKDINVAESQAGTRFRCPGCGRAVLAPVPSVFPDFDALLEQCMNELQIKTAAHEGIWQLSKADWDLDQDAGTITFTSPNGLVATCPVQIIGTFNIEDNTWLWAWDHPSVDPALQTHAQLCRTYGEQNGIDVLTAAKLEGATEDDAWQLTALACKLADAQGGYRGPMGSTLVFVTFGAPSLSKVKRNRP